MTKPKIRIKHILIGALLMFVLFLSTRPALAIEFKNLKCEYLINPIGIDTNAPRFSWQIN